jgi:uncharacterized cupredoxin-like copper-binding protein
MNRTVGLPMLILTCLLAVACASPSAASQSRGQASASDVQAVRVTALDTLKFEPAVITVKSGTPVRLTLENTGALEHDLVIDNVDGQKIQAHAKPKSTAAVEFTPTAPGTYEFYCSVPGHREAGMKGVLNVQ